MSKKAVILLSGGLDSATCLAIARSEGFECYALSFAYGQRNSCELKASGNVAASIGVADHVVIDIDLRKWGGSALTDDIEVPNKEDLEAESIPVTYVPARNLIFLSLATGYAEAIGAKDIFIGVNSVDFSGYPDCRPRFIEAFQQCATIGTKAEDEGWGFNIHAPLQFLNKAQIIGKGTALGVDYSLTRTCYNPSEKGLACGKCDSCHLRRAGFMEAGVKDPTPYA